MGARAAAGWLALGLAAALLGAAFASLGNWQLERAAASRAVRERFEASGGEAALDAVPRALGDELRYRLLEVRGHYVPDVQFLLDNRIHDGRAGYEVLTPFRPEGGGEWLLVNRGWIPASPDRRELPEVAVGAGPRAVAGRLAHLPQPGLRLGDGEEARPSADPLQVLSFPSAELLEARLGRSLADFQLLLNPDEPDGFTREWRPAGVTPERNLSYAGQWFLLAAAAAAGTIVAFYRAFRARRT